MRLTKALVLAALLGIELIGLGFFIKGFFPYKKSIPGFATWADAPPDLSLEDSLPIETQYGRLVIMLVDALRNDFVFSNSSQMHFTQQLLRNGSAIGYTAKALAPTVTMPRLKALMTGTVPSFLDAVLNIAESDTSSSLQFQDNLLLQLRNCNNMTINMFGDDTWLRLFPGVFSRTDGTSSFFVADTVEVDLNVTRHVEPELERDDWDAMVLHYLGLDHIGHLAGPRSDLMPHKQREMDAVVETIYKKIREQDARSKEKDAYAKPTLFVLLGDHAMNEIGNHGGNSHLETSTVFVFMGEGIQDNEPPMLEELMKREVSQINLVPTLALLFGVPIPKNNLGIPLPELLAHRTPNERLRMLQLAAHQIYSVILANDQMLGAVDMDSVRDRAQKANRNNTSTADDCDTEISDSRRLKCLYEHALVAHRLSALHAIDANQRVAESKYYEFMTQANAQLSRAFSEYNLGAMWGGILIIGIALLGLVTFDQLFCGGLWRTERGPTISIPSLIMVLTYFVSISSSSMIEEEHQFWYFWVQSMLLLRTLTSNSTRATILSVLQMTVFRVMRAWNQTGQKWAGEPDIRYFLNNSHAQYIWWMAIATVVLFNIALYRLHVYLYPRPAPQDLRPFMYPEALDMKGASGNQRHRKRFQMKYQRDEDEHRRRELLQRPGIAGLYTGKVAGAGRKAILLQRVFRAAVAYGLTCALLYHMDRGKAPEALGMSRQVWETVRAIAPPQLADVARIVYLCVSLAAATGVGSAWYRARAEFSAGGMQTMSLAHAAVFDTISCAMPLLLVLSRPHNFGLYLLSIVFLVLLVPELRITLNTRKDEADEADEAVESSEGSYRTWVRPSREAVVFCLVNASFFIFGNSNSLASVDLSNAYAGVSRYNEALVGLLVFIGSWAGPIFWTFGMMAVMESKGKSAASHHHMLLWGLSKVHIWQAAVLLVLSAVVTVLRTHLFIWSVFSPKYLYQIAWVLGFYTTVATIGGSVWLFIFDSISVV